MINKAHSLAMVLVIAAVTILIRFLPFLVFLQPLDEAFGVGGGSGKGSGG